MLKELLISAAVIAGFASAASAQTCATPPSCASLGYTLTAPKGEGWVCTGCPFDPTKFACTAKSCPPGTTRLGKGAWSQWCLAAFSGDAPCGYQRSGYGSSSSPYFCEASVIVN